MYKYLFHPTVWYLLLPPTRQDLTQGQKPKSQVMILTLPCWPMLAGGLDSKIIFLLEWLPNQGSRTSLIYYLPIAGGG